jgi:hypothetical protein
MKLFTLITSLLLSTQAAHAAPAELLEVLVKHEALQKRDITNIKQTQVYRCPGCYEFEVTIGQGQNQTVKKFGSSAQRDASGKWIYTVGEGREEPQPAGVCVALGRVGGEGEACARHKDQNSCESTTDWEWCAWQKAE